MYCTVAAKIKFRFADRRIVVLPRYTRYLKGVITERSTAFCQNVKAVPFLKIHCLTVATFPYLLSMVTEYCARQFLYFSEKGR